jgi:hypothetical protein
MPRLATIPSDLLGAFGANLDGSAPGETTARKKRAGTSRRRWREAGDAGGRVVVTLTTA